MVGEVANHVCHWPGCGKKVPPRFWGCREHWFALPPALRSQILKEYRPGQEITKTPSQRYLIVAALVQGWIEGKVTIRSDGGFDVLEDLKVEYRVRIADSTSD